MEILTVWVKLKKLLIFCKVVFLFSASQTHRVLCYNNCSDGAKSRDDVLSLHSDKGMGFNPFHWSTRLAYVCICQNISYSSVSWPWWLLKDWFLFFSAIPAAVPLWWLLCPTQNRLGLQRRQRSKNGDSHTSWRRNIDLDFVDSIGRHYHCSLPITGRGNWLKNSKILTSDCNN